MPNYFYNPNLVEMILNDLNDYVNKKNESNIFYKSYHNLRK